MRVSGTWYVYFTVLVNRTHTVMAKRNAVKWEGESETSFKRKKYESKKMHRIILKSCMQ